MKSRSGAIAALLGIMIASQLMGVLAKLALVEVPAFTFVWLQLLSGGVFLTLYSVVVRRDRWPSHLGAREWAAVVFVGVSNFGAVRLLMMMSLERLPATTHVFLISFVSLATMALSRFFLAERPGWMQLAGAMLAIFGVWLFFPDIPPPQELRGVVYAALVVLGLAASNNATRWLMTRTEGALSSVQLSTLALWIGGIPIVVAGLLVDWPPEIGGLRNGLIIFANGVVGIAFAMTVFNAALRALRSFEASVLAGSGVVWTALLAIPILGEVLGGREVLAIVVLLSGLALAQLRPEEASSRRYAGSRG